MHPDQLTVTARMVRQLVGEQFPRWRGLGIRAVRSPGTVNAIFRVGDGLAARFPLRLRDAASVVRELESEAAAARELAGRTRFATPEPVALGAPGAGYPLPWSVQTWLPGVTAADEDPGDRAAFARDLAEFVAGVRAIGTAGRSFGGRGRGGDLRSHDAWVETCFERSEPFLDVPRLRRIWARLRELPRGARPDVMSHGDLIPGNVLVSGGRLTGVLDVGGLGPADPALDLVAAWHLLEPAPRRVFRGDLGCDDLEWERGKAWAFEQALGLVWYYAQTNPAMARLGRATLRRIEAAEAPPAKGVAPAPREAVRSVAVTTPQQTPQETPQPAPQHRADLFLDPAADPREGGPRLGDERATLTEFLRFQRLTLRLKCDGLDAAQLARRSVEPSTMSLLGLVRHMAEVERGWFRRRFAGQDVPKRYQTEADPDGDFNGAVADPAVVEEAWAAWREEMAFADEFTAGHDLDFVGRDSEGGPVSLRELLVHMVEEYARHNGHADLLRERIDGRIGQ